MYLKYVIFIAHYLGKAYELNNTVRPVQVGIHQRQEYESRFDEAFKKHEREKEMLIHELKA